MSSLLRIGIAAEGATDHIVIQSVITSTFSHLEIEFTSLQPELSEAFIALAGPLGLGWNGVFKWAEGVRSEGNGSITGSLLLAQFDMIVVHLDCDVASATYANINATWAPDDLPCALPWPPITPTLEALEAVLLGWLGVSAPPQKLVLCIPAQAIEGWLVAALYPRDADTVAMNTDYIADPTTRLSSKPRVGRLVSGGRKIRAVYEQRAPEVSNAWPRVVQASDSASRFDTYLRSV